jgi:hypothetical protein
MIDLQLIERTERDLAKELMVLRCIKRDVVLEAARAEWWATKASATRRHDEALEAASAAGKAAWRCGNLLASARSCYEVLKKLIGALELGDAGAVDLRHAQDLGELVRQRCEHAHGQAQRAQDASRALAPVFGEVRS